MTEPRAVDPYKIYRSGSTEPWTVDVLVALLRAKGAKIVLELGTYLGLTTERLAEALPPDGTFITVEADPERHAAAAKRFENDPRIRCVCAEAVAYLRAYDGPPACEFAFVDDDHTAAHVTAELNLLWPLTPPHTPIMARGGLIAVHDVVGRFNLAPIVEAHHGYVLPFRLLHEAGGLGLIQVPQ